jgi:hypothetical protein
MSGIAARFSHLISLEAFNDQDDRPPIERSIALRIDTHEARVTYTNERSYS